MTELTTAAAQSYLILLHPELVARDVALTISDQVPTANVIMARSPESAAQALDAVTTVAVAFLAMEPDAYVKSQLAEAIRARGGRAVLISDAAEAVGQGPDWIALARPFTTECVVAVLALRAG